MAVNFPASLDTYTAVDGTTLLTSGDGHAGVHNNLGSQVVAIETNIGTNSGTNILKNFAAGNFPARINATNVLQQALTGTVTGIITGQSSNSGTIAGGVYGTATWQGGTIANAAVGTPTILGGTIAGSGTTVPIRFGVGIAPNAGSITDAAGGTFQVNAATAQLYFSVMGTAAGNRTIETPLNPTSWQTLNYAFQASGSANGTLVWGTAFGTTTSLPQTLGTGTSWSYYSYRYNPISTKWDIQGNMISVGI